MSASHITKVHPKHIGTPAEDCPSCQERTLGVALDCAIMNGATIEQEDEWAAYYVESGTSSAYYCTEHDPVNA